MALSGTDMKAQELAPGILDGDDDFDVVSPEECSENPVPVSAAPTQEAMEQPNTGMSPKATPPVNQAVQLSLAAPSDEEPKPGCFCFIGSWGLACNFFNRKLAHRFGNAPKTVQIELDSQKNQPVAHVSPRI